MIPNHNFQVTFMWQLKYLKESKCFRNIYVFWRIIDFRDLGYAPINRVLPERSGRPLSAGSIGVFNADDTGADCGPVGPPDPDYVPGSVVIDRELVENEGEIEDDASRNIEDSEMYVRHYAGDSDEEDDSDDSTSGIFARLKSVAQKYGPPCGAV